MGMPSSTARESMVLLSPQFREAFWVISTEMVLKVVVVEQLNRE